MNTPVTFEIKQLLYDKGWRYELGVDETGHRVKHSLAEEKWNKGNLTYIDITISEVVMWLYEKHGIWIDVNCYCYGILWYAKLSVASDKNWANIDLRHEIISADKKFPNEHNSPTEAYEAAIEYTLKNLI